MILREPCLRPGWYPGRKEDVAEFLEPVVKRAAKRAAPAAVAPHAGWYYSGLTAALAVSTLDSETATVVVIGGHLGGGMPPLIASEDGVKTPLGVMEIDRELAAELEKKLSCRPDKYEDNTVEVLLPMVHYFFPGSRLVWLRFPAALSSFDAGKTIAKTAGALGRRVAVLASTDLTHYGDAYGYCPKGFGKPALDWMKNENDAAFISAVLEGDPSPVLERAEKDRSACSAGAVLGALGFASAFDKTAKLLEYRTSADVSDNGVPGSFVGYAALSFE